MPEQTTATQTPAGAPGSVVDESAGGGVPTATTTAPAPAGTPAARRKIRFRKPSAKLVVGLSLLGAIVLFALFGPLIGQFDPRDSSNPALVPPDSTYWMGTTSLGYDVFAQLAVGARTSLFVGITAGLLAVTLSILFGVVAGYVGGWTDEVLYTIIGVMLVIPGLPLAIVISTLVPGRSALLVAAILGVTGWAGSAVVLRKQAQSLRNRDYVAASRIAGERPLRIVAVEILPNLLPLLTAQFLFGVIFAILGEAGLSYLGLGPTGSISWGTILNEAQAGGALTRGAWWWFIPPGILIALVGTSLALINFSIDEVINPKLRAAPAAARSVRKAREARDEQSKEATA
ncbi:ABC transporter permease [Paraoerskovia marina]|uniref:Peptide/nickel transport system permease protein n=1 Tax=Paraoerskovia marina TaxID=545619 RepID=A0A1H1W6W7_9CELL|nr:ABC transporter permease [Paraoerskovia marina]SDS92226.1 peptide/nickel transport system permease protein [Paraoerskovia marina]